MADLDHFWGGDLSLSATGDLGVVEGAPRGEQRIIRRLCTNGSDAVDQPVGEYVFHPDYGGGFPRLVGRPGIASLAEGIAREQMLKEPAVVQSPPPSIGVDQDALGRLTVAIDYIDAPTQAPQSLNLDVTE